MNGIPILDSLSGAIVVVGEKGIIQYANNALIEMFGYKPDELKGLPLSLLIPKSFHSSHEKQIDDYFKVPVPRGMGSGLELFGQHKNGMIIPIDVSLSFSELEGKKVSVAIVQDISERKQIIEELSASKAMYKALVDNIQEYIYRVDKEGRIEYLNRTYPGSTIEDHIGRYIYDFETSEESKQDFKDALKSVIENGNSEVLVSETGEAGKTQYFSTALYPIFESGITTGATLVSRDITLQFLQEKELIDNQEYIDKINGLALTGLYIVDLETKEYKYTNSYFKVITGMDRAEVNKLDADEIARTLFKPEELEGLYQNEEKLLTLKKGEVLEFEFQYKSPHKGWMWILTRRSGFEFDSNGKPLTYIGSYIDITKLKKSQLELKKHSELYSHVIDSAELGIWEWNLDTGASSINERWASMLGYTLDEIANRSVERFEKLAHPDDLKKSDALLKNHLEGKSPLYECELRLKHKEGHWIWVLDKGKVVDFKQDGSPELIIGSQQNITNTKNHEEELEKRQNEIEQLYNKFNHAVKGGNVGVWQWELPSNKMFFSTIWKKQLGFEDDELANKFNSWGDNLHPDDKTATEKLVADFVESDEIEFKAEFRMLHKDGSFRWILSRGTMERDDTGKPVMMMGTHIDITEQKSSTNALEKAHDLLEKTNEIAKIGTWEFNLENNTVIWSEPLKKLVKFEEEGSPSLEQAVEFYHEEDRERIGSKVAAAIEKGEDYDEELRVIRTDGKEIWTRTIGVSEFVEGECIRLYGMFQDITDKKLAALEIQTKSEDLEKANDLLEQINEVAKIGTWEIDAQTEIRKFSPIALDILERGTDYKPTFEEGIDIYAEGDSKEKIRHLIGKAIKDAEEFDQELLIEPTAGSRKWIRAIGAPVFSEGNHIRTVGLLQDISARKIAEVEIQEKSRDLEQANRLLQQVNDVANTGTWEIDLKTLKRTFGKIACRILGQKEGYSPVNEEGLELYVEGYSRDLINEKISRAIAHGEDFDVEVQIKTKNDHSKWVRAIGVCDFIDGKHERLFGLIQDIDEKKTSAIQIQEKNEALERANLLQEQTNQVARIGTWEMNLKENTIFWSKVTREIHEVDENFEPELETAINFYEEGKSRDTITAAVNKSIENGESFDVELQIVTAKKKGIWIRAVGLTEFENGECTRIYGLFQDINIQKTATLEIQKKSNELEEAERLLRTSSSVAQIGSWEFNPETQVGSLSNVACQIYGFEEESTAPLKESLNTYVEGESRDTITACVKKAIEQGENYDIEVQLITASGVHKWVRAIGISEFESGVCNRLHGIIQDITEQKTSRIELQNKSDELEEAQALLTRSSEVAKIGSWEVNLETYTTTLSPSACKVYGLLKGNQIPVEKGLSRYVEGVSRDTITNCVERAIEKGENYDVEVELRPESGETKWIRTIGVSEFENGVCNRLHGIIQDITEQKNSRIEIQNKSDELQKAQDLLNSSNKVAQIGTWELDIPTMTGSLSKVACDIYGVDEGQSAPLEEALNTFIEGESRDTVNNCVEQAIAKGENYDVEVELKTADGEHKWVRTIGISEFENGNCIRLHGLIQDISAQKFAQIELEQKSNELIRAQEFIDSSNKVAKIGTWDVDLKSGKINWSAVTKEIHEVDSDYVPTLEEGINFYQEGESRDKITQKLDQALHQGKSYDVELQIITATGNLKWVRSVGIPEFIDGECVRLHGLFQDIDDRKKASEKIALQESLLQKTFDSTAIGMTLLDLDANLIKVNNEFCRYIGYPENELLGKNYSEFTYIEDAHICDTEIADLLAGRSDKYQIEKRYVHKKGHVIWALVAVSMVRTPEGDPLHFVAQINDISERKLAQVQFQENYDRLQGILDGSTHVGIIETDVDGTIRTFNKGAENLLGYSQDEMVNTNIAGKLISIEESLEWRDSMPDEIGKLEGFSSVVAALEAGLFTRTEWTYVRKDGSTFPGMFILTPIYDANGIIKSTVGIISDLTQFKEAEQENNTLLDVTQQQNKRLLNFTHIVSHNLRSHSSNISMLLGFIRENATELLENEYIQMLDTASGNLEQTITHLNEVVAVHTDVHHISEHVNLQQFVASAIDTVQAVLVECGGEIDNRINEKLLVHGIPAYLESVILNIITNAVKYRSPDREIFIEVFGEFVEGFYILHIKDNGLGIDLERHGDKIFGMYKTFHDNPDARGVGLFLAKSQIEAMEGKIEVESTPALGTTFSIYFKI